MPNYISSKENKMTGVRNWQVYSTMGSFKTNQIRQAIGVWPNINKTWMVQVAKDLSFFCYVDWLIYFRLGIVLNGRNSNIFLCFQSSDGRLNCEGRSGGIGPGPIVPDPTTCLFILLCHRRSKCIWCAGWLQFLFFRRRNHQSFHINDHSDLGVMNHVAATGLSPKSQQTWFCRPTVHPEFRNFLST